MLPSCFLTFISVLVLLTGRHIDTLNLQVTPVGYIGGNCSRDISDCGENLRSANHESDALNPRPRGGRFPYRCERGQGRRQTREGGVGPRCSPGPASLFSTPGAWGPWVGAADQLLTLTQVGTRGEVGQSRKEPGGRGSRERGTRGCLHPEPLCGPRGSAPSRPSGPRLVGG